MIKLRKRFWMFVLLAVVAGVLTWFFAYSFMNMSDALYVFGGKEMEMGVVPWYYPAVFWLDWFSSWYRETFNVSDPAQVSSAMLTTIQVGFGLSFGICETGIVLAGREWFVKRRGPESDTDGHVDRKRPWYFVAYLILLTVLLVPGWLFLLGLIVLGMFKVPAAAFAMGMMVLGGAFFSLFSLYGLWRRERWGFWGLFWLSVVSLVAGPLAGAALVSNLSNLLALLLLLLVVFAGGRNSVWKQLG